jgi:DNA-directed RNA polymerase subunit RPC12/RpoP
MCTRCGGRLFWDPFEDEARCLNCGRTAGAAGRGEESQVVAVH